MPLIYMFYGLLTILILFLSSRLKYYILVWKIGGPFGYPILGVGLEFLKQENILKYVLKLRNKYGPVYSAFLGLTPIFVISEPNIVEKLLTSTAFINKSLIYNGLKVALGDGLFTSDYTKWNKHRKLINPAFSHKILISFYPIFNKKIKHLNVKLQKLIGQGPVDIQNYIRNCSLDITCQTTMGKDMNFQNDENLDIIHGYEELLVNLTKRIFIPWYVSDFSFSFFPSPKKAYYSAVNICNNFVDKLIQMKKLTRNSLQTNITDDDDDTTSHITDEFGITKSRNIFLDQAFKLMDTNNFTENDVRNESNTMVAAAFETTANVVHKVILCLAMFPEYQDRLFDEIISFFPDKNFEATYDDTQQMVYLEMVINETMRLLAPVPLIARKCTEEFDLGNGIIVPKGTQMAVDIFNMQRCEKIWGPKAKTFDPDHFLKDNFSRMHPYSFIPFTKGLRNCIGWRYGTMALKVFLVQMLRSYRFTTDFKYEDLEFVEDITLKLVKTPLVKVYAREK